MRYAYANRNFPMRYPIILIAIFFSVSVASCDYGDEEPNNYQPSSFSEADLAVLNQTLNLGQTAFNYSNPTLPQHFREGDATETDNTPSINQITDMGASLGRVLFYDVNLSANNTISCASCHKQDKGFSDDAQFSVGLNGETTRRNSMTLINSRYYENGRFFWDERANTLEDQVLMPIQDHVEMGLELPAMVSKLQQLEYYPILFKYAFGSEEITANKVALALAQFTRSIISYQTRFDEGYAAVGFPADEEEMPDFPNFTAQENLGMDIFYRGRKGGTCLYCHGSPQHVNDEAKNNGLALNYTDNGKGEITGNPTDMALFKVPSLRNIALTAPYMHDGRFETLMDVVNHYSDNVQHHENLNFRLTDLDDGQPGVPNVLRLNLTQQEKEGLVAFLHTLTDASIATDEKFSDPFQ